MFSSIVRNMKMSSIKSDSVLYSELLPELILAFPYATVM